MPRTSRIATVGLIIAMTLLGGASVAQANQPPAANRPLDCLAEWNTNPLYVADGWVDAPVAEVNGVFLGCGDLDTGVVHIGDESTRGTLHPITPGTEDAFLVCFESLARFGTVEPDPAFPQTRDRYRLSFTEPTQFGDLPVGATMYVDREQRFVYTIFTSKTKATPQGNNWSGCSNEANVA
jgi:hypothetical protein